MAVGYAMHYIRSHHAVIRVYDSAGNVIETHEHKATSKNGECFRRETKSRHEEKHDGFCFG